jgi:hypothetical protein
MRRRGQQVRIKRRHPDHWTVERFFQARDALVRDGLGAPAEAGLNGLSPAHVRAVLTRLSDDDRSIPPPLEPMLPALAETVLSWSDGQRRVLVIHDEQSALTADRLTRLQQVLANDGGPSPASADEAGALPAGVSPLAGLVMVDSRDDPRVQVADLLAGVARRLPGIINDAPLRPFLSPTSLRDPKNDARSLVGPASLSFGGVDGGISIKRPVTTSTPSAGRVVRGRRSCCYAWPAPA